VYTAPVKVPPRPSNRFFMKVEDDVQNKPSPIHRAMTTKDVVTHSPVKTKKKRKSEVKAKQDKFILDLNARAAPIDLDNKYF